MAKTKQRIIRTQGHNKLPNFIGHYFPRRDDSEIHHFYCACMLVLLKPWRNIHTDLKIPSETWQQVFESFIGVAPTKVQEVISGIQYLHECETATRESRDTVFENPSSTANRGLENDEDLGEDGVIPSSGGTSQTEEGLIALVTSLTPWAEENHGRHAVEIGKAAKIFPNDNTHWSVIDARLPITNATGNDIQRLMSWKAQMEADVNNQNSGADEPRWVEEHSHGDVTQLELLGSRSLATVTHENIGSADSEESLPGVDPSLLKPDQFRAYDIVIWHLNQTLAGEQPPPLRMIIHGEGGTGKSKVIQTITDSFVQQGAKYMLLKAAYTGVAASLIDGKTTHTIGIISRSGRPITAATKAKLQQFWKHFTYLVIDEFSMLSKTFLAKLSRNIGIGKETGTNESRDYSFNGINVILCGDLHQFPPVAVAKSEALYHPVNIATDSVDAQVGCTIYEEFATVVILREQVRVTDNVWHDFLQHLRHGRVQQDHVQMLRKQLISSNCPPTDFNDSESPWNGASLVTPRHAVRKQWNEAAVRKHCKQTGQQLFICTAEDTIRKRPLTLAERYAVATRHSRDKGGTKKRRQDLPDIIEIAVGMKVMVTQNVETDLDVTNGARGEIVDIILHPDKPDIGNEAVVNLEYLPAYVLVKLNRTRATQLDGLAESVIPVEVSSKAFQIKISTAGGKQHSRTVVRRQFPMTGAYAFTDYRSQGQTIPYVIVDIASPPTGSLSLFNLYVALSRSSGRSTIRLLCDFDDNLFQASHEPELIEEDERLERVDLITREWWMKMRQTHT